MRTTPVTPGSIVVGVDGSPSSMSALRWALADAERTDRPLHVVHALEVELVPSPEQGGEEHAAERDAVLNAAMEAVRESASQVSVTAHSMTGFAPSTLVAASRIAGTVVLGSRGRGAWRAAVLGSVSQQVAEYAECPVVIVPEDPGAGGIGAGGIGAEQVVVGVDGSEVSRAALAYAFAYASSTGAGLTVVHTWWWRPLRGGHQQLVRSGDWVQIAEQEAALVAELLACWLDKYSDVQVRQHVVRGYAVDELVRQSSGADLLVVGSRGRGGFAGLLLGSVSQGVLHHASCPVAVVRPEYPGRWRPGTSPGGAARKLTEPAHGPPSPP